MYHRDFLEEISEKLLIGYLSLHFIEGQTAKVVQAQLATESTDLEVRGVLTHKGKEGKGMLDCLGDKDQNLVAGF